MCGPTNCYRTVFTRSHQHETSKTVLNTNIDWTLGGEYIVVDPSWNLLIGSAMPRSWRMMTAFRYTSQHAARAGLCWSWIVTSRVGLHKQTRLAMDCCITVFVHIASSPTRASGHGTNGW